VAETDERGRTRRTTRNRDEGRGTPQGAPLSPLLSNLYLRRLILGWKVLGHERRLDAHIVNYADDFVVCCRGTAAEALPVVRDLLARLRLTLNEAKTRLCRGPDEPFDFLGYTIGRCYLPTTGGAYLGVRPSASALGALYRALRVPTGRSWLWLTPTDLVGRLNQQLRGWANYFRLGTVTAAYRQVMAHPCYRLRRWLGRKYGVRGPSRSRFSDHYLHDTLGLLRLQRRPPGPSWATV